MSWLPADRRQRRWLWGILGLALALRLGAACGLQYLLENHWHREFLIPGDAEGYWELGQKIARGADYAVHNPPRYVHRMPGFPTLLAISVLLFGKNLFAARVLLAIVGTLACWLVYVLGKVVIDERTGLLSAGLAAVSPVFVVFSVEVLSETAFAAALLLSLISVHVLYRTVEQTNLGLWRLIPVGLLAGAAIGLACYMRPSWILAAPLSAILLAALTQRRVRGALAGGLVVLGTCLALLPWGIRNQAVSGHFTLTTFWMGPSLYDGLNPNATGESDMRFFDEDRLSARLSEYEVDQHYRRQAWEFVRDNPGQTASLAAVKLWRYWKPWPNAEQFGSLWASLAVGATFLPMLVAGIWGAVMILTRGGERSSNVSRLNESRILQSASCNLQPFAAIWSVAILAGPIFCFSALHTVFVSSLRYRLPVEYPMLVLSAYGLWDAWSRLSVELKRLTSWGDRVPDHPAVR